MIILDGISKSFRTKKGRRTVIDNITMEISTGARVGLIGRNGAGKSTLLKIISGSMAPDTGRVIRRGKLSWPLGFSGGIHHTLTGSQNVAFVARIYNRDIEDLQRYVSEFAELGQYMEMPVSSYSSGMRARLAFGLSLGVSFDYYLIDEITSVGDRGFAKKARNALVKRLENSGVILVSHAPGTLRQFCTSGLVLEDGHVEYYEDIEDAIGVHENRF